MSLSDFARLISTTETPAPEPSAGPPPNKLAIIIVQSDDVAELIDRLVADHFGATRIDAAGGFLRTENAIVLVATHDVRMPTLLEVVRRTCRQRVVAWFPPMVDAMIGALSEPIDIEVGGAVIFIVPIERVEFLGGSGAATHSTNAESTEVSHETASLSP